MRVIVLLLFVSGQATRTTWGCLKCRLRQAHSYDPVQGGAGFVFLLPFVTTLNAKKKIPLDRRGGRRVRPPPFPISTSSGNCDSLANRETIIECHVRVLNFFSKGLFTIFRTLNTVSLIKCFTKKQYLPVDPFG